MSDVESWVEAGVAKRMEAIRALEADPARLQREKLLAIVRNCADTEFGRAHDFGAIRSVADYQARVPPSGPEAYDEAWNRTAAGERNILFPEPVHAYALSSGTMGKEKMVPLNKALVRSLRRAIGYTTAGYMADTGDWSLLRGYALQMAAPAQRGTSDQGVPIGYITGIMGAARTYPFHQIGIPRADVLDLDWQEKYEAIEARYLDHDVRMIFGIPGYILGLLRRVARLRESDTIEAVWPNLRLVVTSGVALAQDRARFERLCPRAEFREMYLCTEAAIAFQPGREPGLLPMVEDAFFEFVPEEAWPEPDAPRLGIDRVETGVRYVLLVTTPSGLYAYSPGDVVSFTSVAPPRMTVEGRLGNVLNLACEKLSGEEAAGVLRHLEVPCAGFLVCPADDPARPGHEWVLEPEGEAPPDLAARIDALLSEVNPLYRHLRGGDEIFAAPQVTLVRRGTFEAALRRRRGQGKILRIHQDRKVRDELVELDRA